MQIYEHDPYKYKTLRKVRQQILEGRSGQQQHLQKQSSSSPKPFLMTSTDLKYKSTQQLRDREAMLIESDEEKHLEDSANIERAGYLKYQKRMKYFPKITTDLEGQHYDCNVQTPLTQLKIKGNKENTKKRTDARERAEVPHGGIWVKRASTRLENFSP